MSTYLFDLDGVIVDWTLQFESDRATHFPHISFEALEEFSTPEHLPRDQRDAIDWVKYRPGFYRDMLPIAGAIEAVEWTARMGHQVFFCSTPETRNPTCASDKLEWVTKYLGAAMARKVILTHDKTIVRGDFLIDDRPDIHGAFVPTWEHVLFSQPYNSGVVDGRARLGDWSQWKDVLLRLERSRESLEERVA